MRFRKIWSAGGVRRATRRGFLFPFLAPLLVVSLRGAEEPEAPSLVVKDGAAVVTRGDKALLSVPLKEWTHTPGEKYDRAVLVAGVLFVVRDLVYQGPFCHTPRGERVEMYTDLSSSAKPKIVANQPLTTMFLGGAYTASGGTWGIIVNSAEGDIYGVLHVRSDGRYKEVDLDQCYPRSGFRREPPQGPDEISVPGWKPSEVEELVVTSDGECRVDGWLIESAACMGSRVRVRAEPSLDGRVLGHLSKGDAVKVQEMTDSRTKAGRAQDYWYRIIRPGLSGWVFGGFLSMKYERLGTPRFGTSDEEGKRLTLFGEPKGPLTSYQDVVCAGGPAGRNWANRAVDVYDVQASSVPGNATCLLADDDFLKAAGGKLAPSPSSGEADAALAGRIERARGMKVSRAWELARIGDGSRLALALYEADGPGKPAGLVLEAPGGPFFRDYDAPTGSWRADDGGTIRPSDFSVIAAFEKDGVWTLAVERAGAEGKSASLLRTEGDTLKEVLTEYRAAAPK